MRKVQAEGWFTYRGQAFRVSKALRGFPIALRQSDLSDSLREVLFCHQLVASIDLDNPQLTTHDLNSKCVTYVLARSVTYLPSPTPEREGEPDCWE